MINYSSSLIVLRRDSGLAMKSGSRMKTLLPSRTNGNPYFFRHFAMVAYETRNVSASAFTVKTCSNRSSASIFLFLSSPCGLDHLHKHGFIRELVRIEHVDIPRTCPFKGPVAGPSSTLFMKSR